jgi:hypothetical protein
LAHSNNVVATSVLPPDGRGLGASGRDLGVGGCGLGVDRRVLGGGLMYGCGLFYLAHV